MFHLLLYNLPSQNFEPQHAFVKLGLDFIRIRIIGQRKRGLKRTITAFYAIKMFVFVFSTLFFLAFNGLIDTTLKIAHKAQHSYTMESSGDDLASTWVAKPEVHVENVENLVKSSANL